MGLMREFGLILHHLFKPVQKDESRKHEVSRKVEEEQVDESVTLRRTTIEEVEIKKKQP